MEPTQKVDASQYVEGKSQIASVVPDELRRIMRANTEAIEAMMAKSESLRSDVPEPAEASNR